MVSAYYYGRMDSWTVIRILRQYPVSLWVFEQAWIDSSTDGSYVVRALSQKWLLFLCTHQLIAPGWRRRTIVSSDHFATYIRQLCHRYFIHRLFKCTLEWAFVFPVVDVRRVVSQSKLLCIPLVILAFCQVGASFGFLNSHMLTTTAKGLVSVSHPFCIVPSRQTIIFRTSVTAWIILVWVINLLFELILTEALGGHWRHSRTLGNFLFVPPLVCSHQLIPWVENRLHQQRFDNCNRYNHHRKSLRIPPSSTNRI